MTLRIESERRCEAVIGYTMTTGRRIPCCETAVYLCSSCEITVCEAHAKVCKDCHQSVCRACDHACTVIPASAA